MTVSIDVVPGQSVAQAIAQATGRRVPATRATSSEIAHRAAVMEAPRYNEGGSLEPWLPETLQFTGGPGIARIRAGLAAPAPSPTAALPNGYRAEAGAPMPPSLGSGPAPVSLRASREVEVAPYRPDPGIDVAPVPGPGPDPGFWTGFNPFDEVPWRGGAAVRGFVGDILDTVTWGQSGLEVDPAQLLAQVKAWARVSGRG